MDLVTISRALLRWGIPALAAASVLFLVLAGAYRVYKKTFHGQRSITRVQAVSAGLLCCWLLLVIGLTFLSRGAQFAGALNLDFFSGYRSAWNNWSISELQLILFNVLMFAPLGFLLPLLWRRAESGRVTLAVSLGVTGCIELLQLFTGTGIFELDDLFHNAIGSLFGYFCAMALLTAWREKRIRWAPVVRALLIPGAMGLVLAGVFWAYDLQPYGNLSIRPAVRQDLSKVQVEAQWTPARQRATAAVYRNRYAMDRARRETIRSGLAELEDLTFSGGARWEDENLGYTGLDSRGTPFRLLFFVRTGEWSYTTFAERFAQLTEETARSLGGRYEDWMQELGLLPENAVFSVQNGDTLRWDAVPPPNLAAGHDAFQKGSVMIQMDESGALASLYYQICWDEYAAEEEILSEAEAYARVEQGCFSQYVPFQPGDRLWVTGCALTYLYDSKGFYQPVYQFSGYINDLDNLWVGRIPALAP